MTVAGEVGGEAGGMAAQRTLYSKASSVLGSAYRGLGHAATAAENVTKIATAAYLTSEATKRITGEVPAVSPSNNHTFPQPTYPDSASHPSVVYVRGPGSQTTAPPRFPKKHRTHRKHYTEHRKKK